MENKCNNKECPFWEDNKEEGFCEASEMCAGYTEEDIWIED